MKKLAIIGAGGFGREILWLAQHINVYENISFVDDAIKKGTIINGHEVIGTIDDLIMSKNSYDVAVAIGNAAIRKMIVDKLSGQDKIQFPNLIDPTVEIDENSIGKGNIICKGNIFTVDYSLGNFNIINLSSTIGHDVTIGNFVTVYPGVNISGNIEIDDLCEIGTGSKLIQGIKVHTNSIIGAGSVVIKDIPAHVMAAGVPACIKKERS